MRNLFFLTCFTVFGFNAFAATPDISGRSLQTIHPDEATQPNYGIQADPVQLKAFEASLRQPVFENQYHIRFLHYFAKHPIVAFFLIFLLMLLLPLAVSLRHHP